MASVKAPETTPPKSPEGGIAGRLVSIINTFEEGVPGVRGSAVADRQGLPIANGFREPFDLLAVTAMSTLALQSSRKVFERLGLQRPKLVIIEGETGKVMVHELANGEASFIALVRPETNLGLLKLEMSVAARKLEATLGFAAPTAARVEEILLLDRSGLLIGHVSVTSEISRDHDIVAGMLSAVQSFVRDLFREEGETLKEIEMAHLRLRLVQGSQTTLAIVASGTISDGYMVHAREALRAWEQRNRPMLEAWRGDVSVFADVDSFLEGLLERPTT